MDLHGKTQLDFMRMARERALEADDARRAIRKADDEATLVQWAYLSLIDGRQNHPMVGAPALTEDLLMQAAAAAAAVIRAGQ